MLVLEKGMEKILLIINANRPDIASIDFACRIAAFAQSGLTGLFIENLFFEQTTKALAATQMSQVHETAGVRTDTDQAVRIFSEECERKGISSDVYIDTGEPVQEVIFESRFADLLIVDPDISFYGREEIVPSHFIKEILTRAECPVLIAPQVFEDIDEIIFSYDGSASSVFAIKLFTYLFPGFKNRNVTLLEIKKSAEEEFDKSHRRVMQLLRDHFETVYYHVMKGDVNDELFVSFFMKKKKLIVMGAYGRSMLSRFFKRSSAEALIRMVDLPIFITHH